MGSVGRAAAKHGSLRELGFRGCGLGGAEISAFCAELPRRSARALEVLNLDSNAVGDVGLEAIAAALARGALPRLRIVVAPQESSGWSQAGCHKVASARRVWRRQVRVTEAEYDGALREARERDRAGSRATLERAAAA